MPLDPNSTNQFKKDYQRVKKRGWDVGELKEVMLKLINEEPLDPNRRPHPLKGEYVDCRECHVGGDFLLIWSTNDRGEIWFIRTGSHEDLFD